MRSALATVANRRANRQRSNSLTTIPPARASSDYLPELAATAASILYKNPRLSKSGNPIYIINAAALPDAFEADYDGLLPYVLARLPGEDELLGGTEYEVIFFAGGKPEGATTEKKQGPGMGWYLQAYHILSRALRKRLKRLYIVHPRTWVRVLVSVFSTVVSPKFRRKITHVNTLTALSQHLQIETLLIPPAVYLHDRRLETEIETSSEVVKRAFGARHPFPRDMETGRSRLPRVLREATKFVLMPGNVQTEGLFRIPPHSTLAGVIKEAYDRGQNFIVWKEKSATVAQPDMDPDLLKEVKLEDSYGVHLAASLIKTWYRELVEPIFPPSCYAYLRSKYESPNSVVSSEDLIELSLPSSQASPLTVTGREILIRHLYPMLSVIAAHEPENKMSPTNLAICFAMALLRGSNELEDAKMTSIIRRILETAIHTWSQVRQHHSIDESSFWRDLDDPSDLRQYEDPLVEVGEDMHDGVDEQSHRIELASVDPTEEQRAVLSDSRPIALQRRPPPVAPNKLRKAMPPPVPKRKPAPRNDLLLAVDSLDTSSTLIASSPESLGSESPISTIDHISQAPDKSQHNTSSNHSFSSLKVPKRKVLSTEQKTNGFPVSADISRSALESPPGLNHGASGSGPSSIPSLRASSYDDHAEPNQQTISEVDQDDPVFQKPDLTASTTRSYPQLASLARPVLPGSQQQTGSNQDAGRLGTSAVLKPRAPSPGLLVRMGSIEAANASTEKSVDGQIIRKGTWPIAAGLKKASVDDLRRLYEERFNTAQGLSKAQSLSRRGSQT